MRWILRDLFERSEIRGYLIVGNDERIVSGISRSSKEIQPNMAFIAIEGVQVDGHSYIPDAIRTGAQVIIMQKGCQIQMQEDITYVLVENTAEIYGLLCSAFFEEPSKKLILVGATGTNGKSTIATLLYELGRSLGYKCGLLSTIVYKIDDISETATHTTPDAWDLQRLLKRMVDAGCQYAFMEVSSHSVVQGRISGLSFRGGIFTNLTHDHLDYHKTFDAYINAKKKFFDNLGKDSFSLINADEKHGIIMVQNTVSKVSTYGLKRPADYKGRILENSIEGLVMNIGEKEVFFRLIGAFNAENLMAVYGTALLLGWEEMEVLKAMSELRGVPGRFEKIVKEGARNIGVVDYAHTPDALKKVLKTLSEMMEVGTKIITVVGCGGNRDKLKRPLMGKIAVDISSKVIFTSDNPRFEEPEVILEEMKSGLTPEEKSRVITIVNREEAINTACQLVMPGDVILVAGKGHENYQEIKGVKTPFDDRLILRDKLVAGYYE